MEKYIDKFRTCTFYAMFPKIVKEFGYNQLTFKEEKVDAEKRVKALKELQERLVNSGLDPQFKKFPVYQFFTEIGPIKAWAVIQSQMEISNVNLKVVGVFMFDDEAKKAKEYMENKNPSLTYTIQETKITQWKWK